MAIYNIQSNSLEEIYLFYNSVWISHLSQSIISVYSLYYFVRTFNNIESILTQETQETRDRFPEET